MGQALDTATDKKATDMETLLKNCYETHFGGGGEKEWTFGEFYRAVAETVEEINANVGATQLRVPSTEKLREAYERHGIGEGEKLSKDEFQKLLQEVVIGTGFTGVGGVKEFLLFIFGVPVVAVFLKNRVAPKSVPNDLFIPAVTSATVFFLAKFNML